MHLHKDSQRRPKYVGGLLHVCIPLCQIIVHFSCVCVCVYIYIYIYIYDTKETYFQYMFILCILMLQQFVLERMKRCHIKIKKRLFEVYEYNKNSNSNN